MKDALFAIEFKEMRRFQLTLSHRDTGFECGRTFAGTPLLRSNISKFLQNMVQLTNLVIVFSSFRIGNLDVTKLHIPCLVSLDMSGDFSPTGLVTFVVKHTTLHHLHLRFDNGYIPSPFQDHHLTGLRALMMAVRNTSLFGTFLGRRHETAHVRCARRPRLEHLRIHDIDKLYYLNDFIQPFSMQLRRLDLHFLLRLPPFEGGFHSFLSSFRALVELSITLKRRADITTVEGPHARTFTATNLVRLTLSSVSRKIEHSDFS